MSDTMDRQAPVQLSAAEIGALSQLYRGEVYRSTVWRSRLDYTTNWAVASTGLALSITFSSAQASPLPLLLAGLLIAIFLGIEARRYRGFDFWRIRAHIFETQFFGPILAGRGVDLSNGWNETLYEEGYCKPRLHISRLDALGRRLRKNYAWIFLIQALAYLGKLLIHPSPIATPDELWVRAAVGPIPGEAVLLAFLAFHLAWALLAVLTRKSSRGRGQWRTRPTEGKVLELARRTA